MTRIRKVVQIAAGCALAATSFSPAAASAEPDYDTQIEDSARPSVNATATRSETSTTGAGNEASGSTPSDIVYWRHSEGQCRLVDLDEFGLPTACENDTALRRNRLDCPEDSYELDALYAAERDPQTGDLGMPRLLERSHCVSPADLTAAAAREFARLPIEPSPVHVQPPDGWTLINVDTITFTDDEPQSFDAELLGVPVTLRATPAEFAWDYDDHTPALTTTDPGAAYPDHTVAHTYTRPGTATISLTTTWAGQFQITGAPTWTPVPGQATTQSATDPITIHEARSRLVEDPVPTP
jgi:hypothetical protein